MTYSVELGGLDVPRLISLYQWLAELDPYGEVGVDHEDNKTRVTCSDERTALLVKLAFGGNA